MKVYLAAAYERNPEMRVIRDQLVQLGHEVTSRWIDQHGGEDLAPIEGVGLNTSPGVYVKFAYKDLDDVDAAETVVHFTGGGRGGRHTEFGYALARGKALVLVGEREHVFHSLPSIEWYPDPASFLQAWSGCIS
jgi:hypothetical protein